jgi:hypothetical protein
MPSPVAAPPLAIRTPVLAVRPLFATLVMLAALPLLGACETGRADADAAVVPAPAVTDGGNGSSPTPVPPEEPLPLDPRANAPELIRGLYLNASAAGSSSRLGGLLAIADSTEINTFVIDVKDELGIRYRSEIPLAMELAQPGEVNIADLPALLDTLDAHGIYSIARIVVFNDPLLAGVRPEWSIRRPDGSVWLDRSGNSWVSPWEPRVQEYNLAIAEEVARAGFDEVQFDYVRFPEQFQSLPPQVHPRAAGDRTDAITAFLAMAKDRLAPLDVVVAADVFGLAPNTYNDVGIGQQWERIASIADHILPMMYPSHYYPTHLPNVPRPHAMPYETVFKSAGMARLRNDRLREAGLEPARVIVWLQAFQATWLGDGIEYGPEEVRKQKQGVYDVGFDDWILWHPGSRYQPFVGGLDRATESRASESYQPPADVLSLVDRFESLGTREAREEAVSQSRTSGDRGAP